MTVTAAAREDHPLHRIANPRSIAFYGASNNISSIQFNGDGAAYTIAFAPEGADIPPPDTAAELPELGAIDGGESPTASTVAPDTQSAPTTTPATDSTTAPTTEP